MLPTTLRAFSADAGSSIHPVDLSRGGPFPCCNRCRNRNLSNDVVPPQGWHCISVGYVKLARNVLRATDATIILPVLDHLTPDPADARPRNHRSTASHRK